MPIENILLPVQASRDVTRAVRYLADEYGAAGVRVHLLNVQPAIAASEVRLAFASSSIQDARAAAAEETLRPVSELLATLGIEHTMHVALGDVAEAIVRCASNQACDGIVLTEGRSALRRSMLGSVAAKVINLTDLPVTLIKESSEAETAALLRPATAEGRAANRRRRLEAGNAIEAP